MNQRKGVRLFFFFSLMMVAAMAIAAQNQVRKQVVVDVYEPVGTETIQPCCTEGEEIISTLPPSRPVVKPEGNFFDEPTMEMLKRQAETNPNVPRGEEFDQRYEPMMPEAPRFLASFAGINAVDAVEDGSIPLPPDTIVAVGPNNVIEATNAIIRMSSRTNTSVILQSYRNHFKTKDDYFDPKVIFDRFTNRFVIIGLIFNDNPRKSALFISISKSPNPASLEASDWCNYRLATVLEGSWADFPAVGVNENFLVVTTNQFGFADSRFKSVVVRAISKNVFNNASSCPAISTTKFVLKDGSSFTLQPAVHNSSGNLASKPLYMVSNLNGSSTIYFLWRLTANPTQLSKIQLEGSGFDSPPNARQKGGGALLDTGDDRVLQTVFRNGEIWAVHSTACRIGSSTTNVSCVRVIRFAPTDSGASVDLEKTYGVLNQFIWMPAIAVNKNGDAAVVFQRSSQSLFLSSAVNGKKNSVVNFDNLSVVKGGTCHYELVPTGGTNRTGDYTGAQVDPIDDVTFWLAAEFSARLAGSTRCLWATQIIHATY